MSTPPMVQFGLRNVYLACIQLDAFTQDMAYGPSIEIPSARKPLFLLLRQTLFILNEFYSNWPNFWHCIRVAYQWNNNLELPGDKFKKNTNLPIPKCVRQLNAYTSCFTRGETIGFLSEWLCVGFGPLFTLDLQAARRTSPQESCDYYRCIHRRNLRGYEEYRYPHFLDWGYSTPTFQDEKVKNLLSPEAICRD